MKKNGFTLIELLAVIVILAIIALIAVPQVMKIMNKARLQAAVDTTYGIAESTKNYLTELLLQNGGETFDDTITFECDNQNCTLDFDSENNLSELRHESILSYKGKKVKGGTIIVSSGGTDIQIIDLLVNEFVCQYDGEFAYCEQGNKSASNTVTYLDSNIKIDTGEDSTINIADEIDINGEKFYIINVEGNKITALAKYGLNLSKNRQTLEGESTNSSTNVSSNTGYTRIPFGSNYWSGKVGYRYIYSGEYSDPNYPYVYNKFSNPYNYVERYKEFIEENTTIIDNARLLTYQEVQKLDNQNLHEKIVKNGQHFWLGSAKSYNQVWDILPGGDWSQNYSTDNGLAVRPVIEFYCIYNQSTQKCSQPEQNINSNIIDLGNILVDKGDNNIIDKYDELTIGTEKFDIISVDEYKITALAKYGLNLSRYKQTELYESMDSSTSITSSGYSRIRFGNSAYWSGKVGPGYIYPGGYSEDSYPYVYNEISIPYQYVEEYKRVLENEFGAEISNARLLTYSEVKEICNNDCIHSIIRNGQHYWLGTAKTYNQLWVISTSGEFSTNYYNDNGLAIRPVIEIDCKYNKTKKRCEKMPIVDHKETINNITIDKGENNIIDFGDKVIIGTEEFYIIKKDNNKVTALSRFGLNFVKNRQTTLFESMESSTNTSATSGYTRIPFGSRYWNSGVGTTYPGSYSDPNFPNVYDSNSNAYAYIENYINELESYYDVEIDNSRLLTKQEVDEICNGDCTNTFIRNGQHFWLGSANSYEQIWNILPEGTFSINYTTDNGLAVRPVIEFSI